MIRTLIVDDEAPARAKLRRFLADDPEVRVVGEATHGAGAIEALRRHRPDLVFLDVRMPGGDGFEVVDAVAEIGPHVVFATAYAEHAVRAFEVGAADYLLKPFDRDRFERALARAKERIRAAEQTPDAQTLRELLAALRGAVGAPSPAEREEGPLRRVLVREGDRSFFVDTDQIDWLEADGNYVRIHTHERGREGAVEHLVRATLSGLERRLDPTRFARISRSAVVNLDRVRELHDWSHGDRLLVLTDGTELKLSRRYRRRLEP